MIQEIKKYFKTLENDFIPQLSINCVIFSFQEQTLKVVVNKISLTKNSDIHVLPGGFVNQKENVSDAVERIVKESTGMEKILLKQFAVFGDTSRAFGKEQAAHVKKFGVTKEDLEWISRRFVSICYMALIDANKIKLKPTQLLETAEWLPVEQIKILALDHSAMVKSARESLMKELPYLPVESNLLPSKFTLPQLHKLLETILDRSIDRPNFRRKILKSNLVVKVGVDDSGKRRPADLYQFKYGKKTSFNDALKFGF